MTRRIKRLHQLDLSLEIKDPAFIRPPREAQRNWLLNQAVNEFVGNLLHLDRLAAQFVPGVERSELSDRTHSELRDEDIMEDWQHPIMQAMAEIVTAAHGDVLEIGFGRGVSADYIQHCSAASHVIVECNESVAARFTAWRDRYPARDIRLIFGRWQDVTDQLGMYDGIFFHTYPLSEEEYLDYVVKSETFAEHFFATAAAHLRPGGVFTYMTNEIDSLGRGHQRALFRFFSSFEARVVGPLHLPATIRDQWWADSMVVIKAVK
jgi:guanidinoacetate N-methyltransferase